MQRQSGGELNGQTNQLKLWGYIFDMIKKNVKRLNWENKIEKMNNLLLLWTKRNLTIFLIIKSLIVPIFTYVASTCVVPEKYRKEIDSKCFKFIWNNKPDKAKRNTVVLRETWK